MDNQYNATIANANDIFPEMVCPIDHRPLTRDQETLTCPKGHQWAVKQGIPRMVPPNGNYADAFGLQWKTYRKTQLDSYTKTTVSYDRLRRCLGEEIWAKLHSSPKVAVLETGCGAGRFTEILLNTPQAYITSTDYSAAVEANQGNFPPSHRHRVIQADIRLPPFTSEQFDLVLCLGVVQHTPNPEETILKLYEQVKPSGWLVFDHYTFLASRLTRLSALLIRPILKHLPPEQGLKWTERLVQFFFPMHFRVRHSKPLQVLLSRISPVLTYFEEYPQFTKQLQYEWSLLDTHDYLTDYYKHLRTKKQLQNTLVSLGAVDIYSAYDGNGVEVRCRKPES